MHLNTHLKISFTEMSAEMHWLHYNNIVPDIEKVKHQIV